MQKVVNEMKKLLTLAVLVGGVAAAVAYKLKKQQEEKEMLEMEIDLLNKEIEEGHEECQKENEDGEGGCCCQEESCTGGNEEINHECCCGHEEGSCECQGECEQPEEIATEETVGEECACAEEASNEPEECKCEKDPQYPHLDQNAKDEIEVMNQEMIDSLNAQGDRHEEERPIQHFVEFNNEEDLQKFKKVIVEKGYVVTRGENPTALSVLHIAPVDRSKLVTHIYYIANQAILHNGSYKGWKSRVAY